jgi:hypothetical protein
MVQVKVTTIISHSYPLSYFKSMLSQAQDSKVMSEISCEKFDVVSMMIHKRNLWQRQLESFERTKGEVQSRALSGLRVKGYSCSEARCMSPKTEI